MRPEIVPDEFEHIVAQHYEPLYRFAYSLARTEEDACDLTQQTFYLWAAKGHQLRERSKVKTWLFTTLYRAFLESRRRQTRFPHHALEELASEDVAPVLPNVEQRTDGSEVSRALGKVDEVYRAAVALFYLEDYSYREIARILEIAEGTVKSRIARGIAQLRELMGESNPPSSSRGVSRQL